MASSKASKKRTKKACNAMKLLGISERNVRLALKRLLKAYENDWTYIEEENYRVLVDAIFESEEHMVINNNNDTQSRQGRVQELMVINNNNDIQSRLGRVEDSMVIEKPILEHNLNNKRLRFDSEAPIPDFSLYVDLHEDEEEEEDEEPLIRKKRRTRNRPSSPAGSSVPCVSEMQQMVEHDLGAMDILEREMPKLIHIYRRRDSNVKRTEKVQHDFNLSGESDEEEIEAQSQDRPSSPAGCSIPCSSNYEPEMHKNVNDKGNENEDEVEYVTPSPCLSQIDIVSSSNGEVKLALAISKPSLGFRVPSLDAVMKLVEEKYRIKIQGLGVDFTLSELLKEICECFVEQGNVSNGNNQRLVQTVKNLMEAETQCGQLSLSTTPPDHTDAPVLIPRYVEQGNVSDGNNQSLVQTCENLMEAETQCGQLSLSATPFDLTDAPFPIPRYVEQGNVSDGSNKSLVQTFENLMKAKKQCCQLSLSNAPSDHTDAPVPIPRYVEQGNVSDGSNQCLVQTFDNLMEAETQCGQFSLSNAPSDHTDAPVPIPRYVEQGNVSDGNNQSMVQNFENFMEAETQCGQLSLSTTPFDLNDAPVPIPTYMEQGNVSDGNNKSMVQTFDNLMEAETQCGLFSLSTTPPNHSDAPVPTPKYVEQGNVSDGSNQSLVQNFENSMEAETQCGQLSLSTTSFDLTDAPVPIPKYVEQENVSDGSNQSLVQNFENSKEAETQCGQLSLSTTSFDLTDAPVPIPRYVEQGNVSDGSNKSLVQTFVNLMKAKKQCCQLSLSNAPSDHTDAPVPIPRYVVSSPFTNVQAVHGAYSDVFNRTFRKQITPAVDNLSDSISLTLSLKDDSLQRGTQANLQVFMTAEGKGWGLRTLEDLPKGTYVCKYVGEIVTNTELFERNEENTDEKHTHPVLVDEGFLKDEEALCLDATSLENVARFINHRCEDANLVAIPAEGESPDHHHYHHAFFTARDVKAMEELTWDYGIDFNDDSHPVKAFDCKCGSGNCRQTKHKNEANIAQEVNMTYDKQLIARIQ